MPVTFGAPLALYLPLTGGTLTGALAGTSLTLTTPLAVAQGGTGDTGTAWTAYTPGVASATGSITTLGAVSGRYKTIGKTCFVEMNIAITVNGTAGAYLIFGLPLTAVAAGAFAGVEIGATNKTFTVRTTPATSNTVVFFYDGTYPGGNLYQYVVSGSYETQ